MDINYRDAQKNDCQMLAQYIYYASDGVLEYLFEDIIPGDGHATVNPWFAG